MGSKINKLLNFFQLLGKAIMIPIAALPVAALMLRLGKADVWGPNLFGGNGIPWMVAAGEAVINQMNLLFAIGISVGLADDNNGSAGLACLLYTSFGESLTASKEKNHYWIGKILPI